MSNQRQARASLVELSVGQLAARSGVAVSAIHFYERQGLLTSSRTSGNQRRYKRDALRRLAFIRVAQRVGVPLVQVRQALALLPDRRTPTPADWQEVAEHWRTELDGRIKGLQQLRESFSDCIGCGCLSLQRCHLLNPHDEAGAVGPGALRLK